MLEDELSLPWEIDHRQGGGDAEFFWRLNFDVSLLERPLKWRARSLRGRKPPREFITARGERLSTQWQATEHLRRDAVLWLADHALISMGQHIAHSLLRQSAP